MIVLNSPTAFKELIDKRSISNSSRPKSIIADMLAPHNVNFGISRYGVSNPVHLYR
jgi:hypothetical protein